jgi:hypothetical protein
MTFTAFSWNQYWKTGNKIPLLVCTLNVIRGIFSWEITVCFCKQKLRVWDFCSENLKLIGFAVLCATYCKRSSFLREKNDQLRFLHNIFCRFSGIKMTQKQCLKFIEHCTITHKLRSTWFISITTKEAKSEYNKSSQQLEHQTRYQLSIF